jgi:hypothetical protein
MPRPDPPLRGACRDRHGRGVDAVDAAALARDEIAGRAFGPVSDRTARRRTVLIPSLPELRRTGLKAVEDFGAGGLADGEVVWS